jgi:hypothetical protein
MEYLKCEETVRTQTRAERKNGLYTAQWTLQCAMDVKMRNGRYSAQLTLHCALDVKMLNGR